MSDTAVPADLLTTGDGPGAPDDDADEPLRPTFGHRIAVLGFDLRSVLAPFVVARVLVYLGHVLATAVADRWSAVTPGALTRGLLAWDGAYYHDIGTVGYENLSLDSLRFFPLYPVLSRGVSLAFDGDQGVALVLVANISALVLAVLVRRMVRADFDEVVADRAVWAVMLFPGAFVLVWAYAEALFLALAVGTLYAARRERWLIAACCGFAAGVTRPLGVLLVVPIAIEALTYARQQDRDWVARAAAAIGTAGPVLGTAWYVLWVERAWGKLFLPYTVQSDLRGEAMNPVSRMFRGVADLLGAERFGDGLHVPFAVAFALLAVVAWRRLPRSYAAYASVALIVSLSAANLNSLERYGLNAFPLAVALAVWASTPRKERLAMAVCGAGVVGLSALAWLGRYVP